MAAPSAPSSRALLRGARDRALRRRDARGLRRAGGHAPVGHERRRPPADRPARAAPSRCAPTSTRCRSTRRAAWSSPPSATASCTPAGTTATPRCCSAPRRSWPRAPASCSGELRFLFQPAEERPPGGAIELVRAGALDGVDLVVGCHLWTPLPVGQLAAGRARDGGLGLLHARDHRRRRARGAAAHGGRHRRRRGAGHHEPAARRLASHGSAGERRALGEHVPRR